MTIFAVVDKADVKAFLSQVRCPLCQIPIGEAPYLVLTNPPPAAFGRDNLDLICADGHYVALVHEACARPDP